MSIHHSVFKLHMFLVDFVLWFIYILCMYIHFIYKYLGRRVCVCVCVCVCVSVLSFVISLFFFSSLSSYHFLLYNTTLIKCNLVLFLLSCITQTTSFPSKQNIYLLPFFIIPATFSQLVSFHRLFTFLTSDHFPSSFILFIHSSPFSLFLEYKF